MSVSNTAISAMSYTAAKAQLAITDAAIAAQEQSNQNALAPLLAEQESLLALIFSLLSGANPYSNPALVAAQASLASTKASIAAQEQSNATTLASLQTTREYLLAQIGVTAGQPGGGPINDGNSVLFPGAFPA